MTTDPRTRRAELQDWTNVGTGDGKVATRFPPSDFKCPDCQQTLLQDNWPPNYGGGSASGGGLGGRSYWTSSRSQKCVCLRCKTAVCLTIRESSDNPRTVEFSERVPLVQSEHGVWLTPHDVWREKYKAQNGEYPSESYG